MNRSISYSVLVLAAALAAACSSSEDMAGNSMVSGAESTAPFTILGASGNGIVNTGASYQEFTAYINVPGKWSVATTKGLANVYPSSGEGPAMAVVQVGENWGAMRENVLTLTAEGAVTRAGGANTHQVAFVQAGNPELDSISTIFSSNKGAGYSYMPGGDFCDGALIQLFNLATLDSIQQATGVRLISDDIYPTTNQEFVSSNSEHGLIKGLTVGASLGLDFASVKSKNGGSGSGSIGVGVGKGHEENSKNKYALKRQKTTQFTREIHYMNVLALLEKAAKREDKQKLLSPGFLSIQETFAKDIAAAKDDRSRQYDICDKFLSTTGPCFISKSVMGSVLDYQISVDSTLLRDTLGIEVALEASFQTKVKGKSLGGEVTFNLGTSEVVKQLTSKTTATVNARGGDVSQVSILVNGGELNDTDITAWQNSCSPRLAVMVDMALIPIYALITDTYAREVLANYFNEKLKK